MIDTKPAIRGLAKVPNQAKDMASALAKLAEDHRVTAEFDGTTGGGHQRVWFRFNGQARQLTFASTPSCGRAGKNNISTARKLMAEMGVDVRSAKEKAMDKTVLGSFSAPTPQPDFLDYMKANPSLRSTPRRFIADRDDFIFEFSCGDGCLRALVGFNGKFVLHFTADQRIKGRKRFVH